MTYEQWIQAAGGEPKAMELESAALSIGREFMPPCATAVLDGLPGDEDYWDWLAEQSGV